MIKARNWKILLPGILVAWGFIATMFFSSLLVYVAQILVIEAVLLAYIHLAVLPLRFGSVRHLVVAIVLKLAGIAAFQPYVGEIARFPFMSVDGPVSTNYTALLMAMIGGIFWFRGFVETLRFLFAYERREVTR